MRWKTPSLRLDFNFYEFHYAVYETPLEIFSPDQSALGEESGAAPRPYFPKVNLLADCLSGFRGRSIFPRYYFYLIMINFPGANTMLDYLPSWLCSPSSSLRFY